MCDQRRRGPIRLATHSDARRAIGQADEELDFYAPPPVVTTRPVTSRPPSNGAIVTSTQSSGCPGRDAPGPSVQAKPEYRQLRCEDRVLQSVVGLQRHATDDRRPAHSRRSLQACSQAVLRSDLVKDLALFDRPCKLPSAHRRVRSRHRTHASSVRGMGYQPMTG